MTERGMIFNGEMVRAILEDRKTQTRRIMKVQPVLNGSFYEVYGAGWVQRMKSVPAIPGHSLASNCPFGLVGDRIWVRETWQAIHDSVDEFGHVEERTYAPSILKEKDRYWHTVYAEHFGDESREDRGFPWRPAIHMPRWASRITLEITSVRVERLNDINERDARAEGIIDGGCLNCGEPEPCGCVNPQPDATDAFAYLWQSIYGQENWDANPWVWVIAFKRIEEQAA